GARLFTHRSTPLPPSTTGVRTTSPPRSRPRVLALPDQDRDGAAFGPPPAMQPSVRRPRNRSVQARTDDRRDRPGGVSGIDVAPCCGPASAGLASSEPRQTMRTLLWGDDARGRERGGMRVWPTPNKYQGGPHDVEHLAAQFHRGRRRAD